MIFPMVDGEILNLRKIWCVEDLTINLNNHGWWLIFALNPTFLYRGFHVSYIFRYFPMNFQCVLMSFPYFSHDFPWFPGFSHVLSHFSPWFSPYVRCFSSHGFAGFFRGAVAVKTRQVPSRNITTSKMEAWCLGNWWDSNGIWMGKSWENHRKNWEMGYGCGIWMGKLMWDMSVY